MMFRKIEDEEFNCLNYYEKVKYNEKYLDEIDLEPYMSRAADEQISLHDLMRELAEEYEDDPLTDDEVASGDIFFYLDEDEFEDYINKRYEGKYFCREDEYFEIPHHIWRK